MSIDFVVHGDADRLTIVSGPARQERAGYRIGMIVDPRPGLNPSVSAVFLARKCRALSLTKLLNFEYTANKLFFIRKGKLFFC